MLKGRVFKVIYNLKVCILPISVTKVIVHVSAILPTRSRSFNKSIHYAGVKSINSVVG